MFSTSRPVCVRISETVSGGSGSSIKLCYIAHGIANVYPRFGTTMEWDTAAGDAILRFAGGRIRTLDRKILRYGKRNFRNSSFIARS